MAYTYWEHRAALNALTEKRHKEWELVELRDADGRLYATTFKRRDGK